MGSLQEQTLSVGSSHSEHGSTSDYNEDGLSLVRYSATDKSDLRNSSCNNDGDDDAFLSLPDPAQRSDGGNLSNTLLGSQRLSSQGQEPFFFHLGETTKSHSESVENQKQQHQEQQQTSTLLFTARSPGYVSSPPHMSPLFLSPRSEQHDDTGLSKEQGHSEAQTFEQPNSVATTTATNIQHETFQNLEAIPSTTPTHLENREEFRQTTVEDITLEELLENNLAVLPSSLAQSSTVTDTTTGSSFNSSEKYRALLERVKRLPLLHAQEQQQLIDSYLENNTLPTAELDDDSRGFQELQQQAHPERSRQYDTIDSPAGDKRPYNSGFSPQSRDREFVAGDDIVLHQYEDVGHSSQPMSFTETVRTNQLQDIPSTPKDIQSLPVSNKNDHYFHQMTAFNDSRKFSTSFEMSPLPRHILQPQPPADIDSDVNFSGLSGSSVTGVLQAGLDFQVSNSSREMSDDFQALKSLRSLNKSDDTTSRLLKDHEMSEISFQEFPKKTPATEGKSAAPLFNIPIQQFDSRNLGENHILQERVPPEDASSSNDLQTQSLSYDDDNEVKESLDLESFARPSPIVFTGGKQLQPSSPPESYNTISGGANYHGQKFVMSYFHDTSPEMLSFTKNIESSDSKSDFFSMTQESYLPLPDKEVLPRKFETSKFEASVPSLTHADQNQNNPLLPFNSTANNPVIGSYSRDVDLDVGGKQLDKSPSTNHISMSDPRDTQQNPANQSHNISNHPLDEEEIMLSPRVCSPEYIASLSESVSRQKEDKFENIPTLSHTSSLSAKQENKVTGYYSPDIPTLSYTASTSVGLNQRRLPESDVQSLPYTDSLSKRTTPPRVAGPVDTDIQTLSHTASLSKQSVDGNQLMGAFNKRDWRRVPDSDVQSLPYTDSLSKRTTPPRVASHIDSDIQTLSHTASLPGYSADNNQDATNIQRKRLPESDIQSLPYTDSLSKRTEASNIHPSPPLQQYHLSQPTHSPKSESRNTLSLLQNSDRTMSELANLPSTTSESLEHQDTSSCSFIDKSTLDLISQLISSKSQQQSDTESSELFTVGKLSLLSRVGLDKKQTEFHEVSFLILR